MRWLQNRSRYTVVCGLWGVGPGGVVRGPYSIVRGQWCVDRGGLGGDPGDRRLEVRRLGVGELGSLGVGSLGDGPWEFALIGSSPDGPHRFLSEAAA